MCKLAPFAQRGVFSKMSPNPAEKNKQHNIVEHLQDTAAQHQIRDLSARDGLVKRENRIQMCVWVGLGFGMNRWFFDLMCESFIIASWVVFFFLSLFRCGYNDEGDYFDFDSYRRARQVRPM